MIPELAKLNEAVALLDHLVNYKGIEARSKESYYIMARHFVAAHKAALIPPPVELEPKAEPKCPTCSKGRIYILDDGCDGMTERIEAMRKAGPCPTCGKDAFGKQIKPPAEQESEPFRVGDVVECVDDAYNGGYLNKGDRYIVNRIDENGWLDLGCPSFTYNPKRFVVHRPSSERMIAESAVREALIAVRQTHCIHTKYIQACDAIASRLGVELEQP